MWALEFPDCVCDYWEVCNIKKNRVLTDQFVHRSKQAPVGRDLPPIEQPIRGDLFGRRHSEALGRADGRIYP